MGKLARNLFIILCLFPFVFVFFLDVNRFFTYREESRFDTQMALDYVSTNARDSLASMEGDVGGPSGVIDALQSAFSSFVSQRYPVTHFYVTQIEKTQTDLMFEIRPRENFIKTASGRYMFGVIRFKLVVNPISTGSTNSYVLAVGQRTMLFSLFNLSPFVDTLSEQTSFRFPVKTVKAVLLETGY